MGRSAEPKMAWPTGWITSPLCRVPESLGSPVGPNSLRADVTIGQSQAQGLSASEDRCVHSWSWRVSVWANRYRAVCTSRLPHASIRHRAGGKGRMPMLAQIPSEPQAARQRGSRGRHATAPTANRPPGEDFSYGLPLMTDIGPAAAIEEAQGRPRRPLCVVGGAGLERYRERVTRAARKHARSTAARERGRRQGISEEEIAKAWESLMIPRLDAPAQSAVRS